MLSSEVKRRPGERPWEASWRVPVAVEWVSARHLSAPAGHTVTTCCINSAGGVQLLAGGWAWCSPGHRTTLQSRCHLASQDKVTTYCYGISPVFIPSLTGSTVCMVIPLLECLGLRSPWSTSQWWEAQGFISLCPPWVQMCLDFCSSKHPPSRRGDVFLSTGEGREPNTAHTSSLVLEVSWRHSYEGIGSSGL